MNGKGGSLEVRGNDIGFVLFIVVVGADSLILVLFNVGADGRPPLH